TTSLQCWGSLRLGLGIPFIALSISGRGQERVSVVYLLTPALRSLDFPLSLSLSLSHTHTHTHTPFPLSVSLSLTHTHSFSSLSRSLSLSLSLSRDRVLRWALC